MSMDKQALVQNLNSVLHRIAATYAQAQAAKAFASCQNSPEFVLPRSAPSLVAVSKTFPAECVSVCYADGQRHFGENYLHELQNKAPALVDTCPDIRWHYIGQIQSNKIRKICETPGLWCIQTLENSKHADLIQKSCVDLNISLLNVFVQVNTSGESNKGGIELEENIKDEPKEALETLTLHITKNCPNLRLLGLMTIGSFAESTSTGGDGLNRDFCALVAARQRVCNVLGLADVRDLELSMGMSNDFETAIRHGATTVRVGSQIFGARNYNKT